ncbi:MAG: hypothetical protein ABI614_05895 [Planctomycetota bacterium]
MTNAPSDTSRPDDARRGHEPDAVSVRWMAGIGLGLLAVVIAAAAGIALAFKVLVPPAPLITADKEAREQLMTPGVQPNQAYDRQRIEAEERAMLSHYGWQDQEHRMARIPIERAMELMAQRKLQPGWQELDQSQAPMPTPAEKEQP